QDLWTLLAYDCYSTIWTPLVAESPTRARRKYPDPDPGPFNPSERARLQQDWCMKVLRHWCENARATILAEEDNSFDRAERPENGRDSSPARLGAVCFPQPCRKRTLLLVIHNNPSYVERLESAERTTYRALFSLAVRVLEHLGF